MTRRAAHIKVTSDGTEAQFDWAAFDGDDCFSDFHVTVLTERKSRRFDFGPCALFGLRKFSKFFTDPTQAEAGLGFRHPDLRYCDIHRSGNEYRLVIRFEGSGLHEEFCIRQPVVDIRGA